jgi:hypothetical protein
VKRGKIRRERKGRGRRVDIVEVRVEEMEERGCWINVVYAWERREGGGAGERKEGRYWDIVRADVVEVD